MTARINCEDCKYFEPTGTEWFYVIGNCQHPAPAAAGYESERTENLMRTLTRNIRVSLGEKIIFEGIHSKLMMDHYSDSDFVREVRLQFAGAGAGGCYPASAYKVEVTEDAPIAPAGAVAHERTER